MPKWEHPRKAELELKAQHVLTEVETVLGPGMSGREVTAKVGQGKIYYVDVPDATLDEMTAIMARLRSKFPGAV